MLNLTWTLGPSELSRSLGFDHFRVAYQMVFGGRALQLRLAVVNAGAEPLTIEEALHSYFAVNDVRAAALEGLGGARYLDKTDAVREKLAAAGVAPLNGWTDRVYPRNTAEVCIHDGNRKIAVAKENSWTTVLWNPWDKVAGTMRDLGDGEWTRFVCVETANAGADALTLAPGAAHTMGARIEVI